MHILLSHSYPSPPTVRNIHSSEQNPKKFGETLENMYLQKFYAPSAARRGADIFWESPIFSYDHWDGATVWLGGNNFLLSEPTRISDVVRPP